MHAQNGLGLKGFLSGRGCGHITTDKKEGPDNGEPRPPPRMQAVSKTVMLCVQSSAKRCRVAQPRSSAVSTCACARRR